MKTEVLCPFCLTQEYSDGAAGYRDQAKLGLKHKESCPRLENKDSDEMVGGVSFSSIQDAICVLQEAGLDTTSVTMSLTMALGKEDDSK